MISTWKSLSVALLALTLAGCFAGSKSSSQAPIEASSKKPNNT